MLWLWYCGLKWGEGRGACQGKVKGCRGRPGRLICPMWEVRVKARIYMSDMEQLGRSKFRIPVEHMVLREDAWPSSGDST